MDSHRTKAAASGPGPALRRTAADVDLEQVWLEVAGEAWASPPRPVERLLVRVLRSPGLTRALVTTPSLVLAWILATLVVLAVGVVLTATSGKPWFALIAPALAGAGVAYAYGPGIDPAYELSKTMALPERLVLLVRVLAVFGVNALFGLVASMLSAAAVGLTLGWLLPMTAISALGLAIATLARSANVGVAAAIGGWALVVLAGAAGMEDVTAAVTSGVFMPAYLAVALVCGWLALYATSEGKWDAGWQWR
jgi:hypothetical protein